MITKRPKIADITANLKIMKDAMNETIADIYIFGEMFLSGYHCKDELRNLAEPLNGPSIRSLVKIAKEKNCFIRGTLIQGKAICFCRLMCRKKKLIFWFWNALMRENKTYCLQCRNPQKSLPMQ